MNKDNLNIDNISTKQMLGLIALAYAFSFLVRMIWVWQFKDTLSFYWNDQLMINTNDGYFFASGVQQVLYGLHESNPRVFGLFDYGVIFFTTLLVKLTPMSIETAILYMPSIISSIVVIPIILIARLYNKTLWGFFSALLGSIIWSYYNRTMTGYYDTDMFSAMAPMFILFFLIKSTIDFNLRSALYASFAIIIYPFLYDQGMAIVYAISLIYVAYLIWYHREDDITYKMIILILLSLIPLGVSQPLSYLLHIVLIFIAYRFLLYSEYNLQKLMIISAILMLLFLFFGNIFGLLFSKISSYIVTGAIDNEGLHFYSVNQTVREAGKIPFETFANRTAGSIMGVIFSLIGYVLLVIRHKAFILALPLIGIGIFSLWGGLRFTVYAVPVAGMSAVYLFWLIAENFIKGKIAQYSFVAIATSGLIYPNITHIIGYKVPTVLNNLEVKDLVALDKIASPKDYTLSWWDYGYPIWFYSDTSTLIDGGKHNNDNFIISKIMLSTSPQQVANLSRLAIEIYSKGAESSKEYNKGDKDADNIPNEFKMYNKDGKAYHAGGGSVIDILLRNNQEDQKDPDIFLSSLASKDFKLPQKTRDIYLYLPYRMLNIFPTVSLFGNLDLKTGKKMGDIAFYPTTISKQDSGGMLILNNGFNFDLKKGLLYYNNRPIKVKTLAVTEYQGGKFKKVIQNYHREGTLSIVFLKSYKKIVIMDIKTFNSTFVQMFMLENYDKNLFELVVASPYSKIYKLKI